MAESEKEYSILKEIAKCSGYEIALMTTFSFEIPYFERAVLSALLSGGVRKVSVFADAGEFTKSLQDVDSCHLGRKYIVNPVRINSSFHPKVILLLGENRAKLIVGSANIKASGYTMNHEIFNFIEYSPEHKEYLDVIVDAINFFRQINEQTDQLDRALLQETTRYTYYHRAKKNDEIILLHNMKEPVLAQVKGLISDSIEEIIVAVPYYDNGLNALSGLSELYPNAALRLYIQDEKSTFPVNYFKSSGINAKISCFDGISGAASSFRTNFYHGKVILFKSKERSYILYGSANCTQAALMTSFQENGNIECDFFEKGERSEFDQFFSGMNLVPEREVSSNLMIYKPDESSNFFYKYGELTEQLVLHIGYASKVKPLTAIIADHEVESIYNDNELVVNVPDELRDLLPDIFTLTLKYDNAVEVLRCWVINAAVLSDNRTKHDEKDLLGNFELDSDGERFREDRINLLKAELTCLQELQDHIKKQAHFNQIRLEQEGNDADDNDYIVDVTIPDEYREDYRRYNLVSKVRGLFFKRFMLRNTGFLYKDHDHTNCNEKDPEVRISLSNSPRRATSEEKSFERFVKGKVRGMLNDYYVEIIEPEHYIGLMDVVLDIFRKYHDEEKVDNIFTSDYIVQTRTQFLIKVLKKDVSDEISQALLMQSFQTLFDNYMEREAEASTDQRWRYSEVSKKLLFSLEQKYRIRSDYNKYIEPLFLKNDLPDSTIQKDFTHYVEDLFGYKNLELLTQFISHIYDNATVSISGRTMKITATSTDMLRDAKPDTAVLREINKFSRNDTPLAYVIIQINSVVPNPLNKNVVIQNIHSIDLHYRKWNLQQIRKNGSKSQTKTVYLQF